MPVLSVNEGHGGIEWNAGDVDEVLVAGGGLLWSAATPENVQAGVGGFEWFGIGEVT